MIHVEEAPSIERGLGRPAALLQAFQRLLETIGRVLDENTLLCVGLLTAVYVPWMLLEVHARFLLNDEIYTVHIAQQPTIRRMLWLAREIDLHPPLHYFLQRWALHLPVPRWLGSRLPSLVAGWAMSMAIFRLSSRRLGNLLGMVAVLFLWVSPAIDEAWDNRPYMLWLCFLSVLMLVWDRAASPFRTWRNVAAVFVATLLMTATHLIGIVCVVPFVMAEGVRYWRERQPDWWLWAALISPAMIGVGYFYQINHLRENSFPVQHLPSLHMAFNVYRGMVTEFFFLLAMSTVIWCYFGRRKGTQAEPRKIRLRVEQGVLLGAMIALPALLMMMGSVLKVQFWARYGFCAVPALGLLVPWLIQERVRPVKTFAVILVAAMLGDVGGRIVMERAVQGTMSEGYYQMGRKPIFLSQLDRGLPIVDGSPMAYTEMSDREPPEIAGRVFYLTDREAALRYSGYTLFDNESKIHDLLHLPTKTSGLQAFLRTHPKFYLVANYNSEQDWLPRKLVDSGLAVQYLGKFVSSYDDDDLFLVTVPAAKP